MEPQGRSHGLKMSFLLVLSFSERFSGSGSVLLKFDFDLLVLESAQSCFFIGPDRVWVLNPVQIR